MKIDTAIATAGDKRLANVLFLYKKVYGEEFIFEMLENDFRSKMLRLPNCGLKTIYLFHDWLIKNGWKYVPAHWAAA